MNKKIIGITIILLLGLMFFGCTGTSAANKDLVAYCNIEKAQIDKDICLMNLVADNNYLTKAEATAYCNMVQDFEIKSDCRTLLSVS